MDYKIAQAVYRSTADLTATETLLLYTLAGAAKDPRTLPSPSVSRLADRSRLAERTVLRTIAGLEARGIITISKRRTPTGKACNVYVINRNMLGQQAAVLESVTPDLESYNNNKPDRMSPMTVCHPTPDRVSPVPLTQSHATPDSESPINNISNNIDNNIDNKQAISSNIESTKISNIETPKETTTKNPTPPPPQAKPSPAAARDAKLTLKSIAIQARDRLVKEGMPLEEAVSRIKAVRDAYVAKVKELKANGYAGIRDKQKYLVAKLVGMAKEGPKQPQAEEPNTLEEIFNSLKTEWSKTYPEVAEHFKYLSLADFWQSTIDSLQADEEAGWASIKGSRVEYVCKRLKGFMFSKVQAWRHDELKATGNSISNLEKRLAELRFEPKGFYHPKKKVEDEIRELEDRLTSAKSEYGNLLKLTTRTSAA